MIVFQGLGYAALLWGLTFGGNIFCRIILSRSHITATPAVAAAPTTPTAEAASRNIGNLERLIIMLGLVLGSWDVIAAVIALKTIARYQELDKRIDAEYYLVGSLASILWALLITIALIWYDHHSGLEIMRSSAALFAQAKS